MQNSHAQSRDKLKQRLSQTRGQASDILLQLLSISSENPPGDTHLLAQKIQEILRAVPGIEIEVISARQPIDNVLAVIRGQSPGRRLIFNGHLDTFEIGDATAWSTNPFGETKKGRIYGRGAADMKGGIAAQIYAALRLLEFKHCWQGELSLTLVGDEETGGQYGTQHLLETRREANGDAMMCADAGSPQVLRFGEKGMLWLTIDASGTAGHGAHVHLSVSAVDRLLTALAALRSLEDMPVKTDPEIIAAIQVAADESEQLSGAGETKTLQSITVNFGTISGGSTRNLIADHATATADIRLPIGVALDTAKAAIQARIGSLPGIRYTIDQAVEPTATDPGHEIVTRTAKSSTEVLGKKAVATMRVGASDSAHYRSRGIASVVCGLTPHNMGGVDEYVLVEELEALGDIYALTGFDYLTAGQTVPSD